jgi:hypothetical protein
VVTRAVLAERWWVREKGNRTIGLSYPNICNTAGALAFIYTLYAAWQQRPSGTTLGTVAAVGLKFWWLRVLVQRYDDRSGEFRR